MSNAADLAQIQKAEIELAQLEAEYGKIVAEASLTGASMLPPPAGTAADIISLGKSLSEGNWGDALLDAVGFIPIGGDAAKAIIKGPKIVAQKNKIQAAIDAARVKLLQKKLALKNDPKELQKKTADKCKKGGIEPCPNMGSAAKNAPPIKRKEVELKPGEKGSWNKQLNGKLKPNTDYKVGNKTYKTDEHGRVKQVSGELEANKHDRNPHQQGKAGREGEFKDGLKKDDGGHLISSRHDGAGEQINYVPMDSNLNRGAWKKMENKWDGALKEGKKVEVDIRPVYEGNSKRPKGFNVKYWIDGSKETDFFKNKPGG